MGEPSQAFSLCQPTMAATIPRFILIDLISYMHLILCYIYNVRPCNNQMPDGSRLLDDGSKLSAKLTYWLSRQWTVTLWNG